VAERRFSFSVLDDNGTPHEGELIIAPRWHPDIALRADAAFAVVLVETPLDAGAQPAEAGIIVCAPAVPARLAATIAEGRVECDAGRPPPIRLPKPTREAYAAGRLYAPHALVTTVRDVFDRAEPRLELLAREAMTHARAAQRYWETIEAVIAREGDRPKQSRAARTRERLRALLASAPALDEAATGADAIARLRRITDGEAPGEVSPSPAELREDVAFLRCLIERPDEAHELAELRAYLDGATPNAAPDLASDHALVRERLSFATLLEAPHQLPSLRAVFDHYRDQYASAYAMHHAAYWSAWERLLGNLHDAEAAAQALGRLNTLAELGAPVGEEALAAYQGLLRDTAACSGNGLTGALRARPRCPDCAISLTDAPPEAEVAAALRGLERGLEQQQARLAGEAVRRILARAGEQRIDRFLQVVQASDLGGLATVLDDDLLAFLRELLAEPASPQVAAEPPAP
jgi:hypothetical protein